MPKISKEEYLVYAVLAQALVDLLDEQPDSSQDVDSALEFVIGYRKLTRRLRSLSPEEKREWRQEILKNLRS